MDSASIAALIALALADSTSFGTLLIPLWLMLSPRFDARGLCLYLAVVAGFYAVVGGLLLLGLDPLVSALSGLGDSRPLRVAQLVVGVGLFAFSYVMEGRRKRPGAPPSRVVRLQQRVGAGSLSPRALVALALVAVALEVATMLPYLAAMGILAHSDLSAPLQAVAIVGYVLVMISPAVLAAGLRWLSRGRVEPALKRLSNWFERYANSAAEWGVGIVGVLLTLNAVTNLAT